MLTVSDSLVQLYKYISLQCVNTQCLGVSVPSYRHTHQRKYILPPSVTAVTQMFLGMPVCKLQVVCAHSSKSHSPENSLMR